MTSAKQVANPKALTILIDGKVLSISLVVVQLGVDAYFFSLALLAYNWRVIDDNDNDKNYKITDNNNRQNDDDDNDGGGDNLLFLIAVVVVVDVVVVCCCCRCWCCCCCC